MTDLITLSTNAVILKHGQPITTSLTVAGDFGRQHNRGPNTDRSG